ncbi:trichohyalin-like [Colossoma macropomum]|uniref:trichohyalin-like n=1 Tax=Colossoma macropomum TaxID=42526 RepID=UPI0018645D3F|nr:trichohyalin-like [Colossoma macropomum]
MAPISESDSDNEDWMSTIPEELWDIPLSCLAVPGSHDAMSYCLDITSSLVRSESDTFRLLDRVFYCFTRPLIYKWATTQPNSENTMKSNQDEQSPPSPTGCGCWCSCLRRRKIIPHKNEEEKKRQRKLEEGRRQQNRESETSTRKKSGQDCMREACTEEMIGVGEIQKKKIRDLKKRLQQQKLEIQSCIEKEEALKRELKQMKDILSKRRMENRKAREREEELRRGLEMMKERISQRERKREEERKYRDGYFDFLHVFNLLTVLNCREQMDMKMQRGEKLHHKVEKRAFSDGNQQKTRDQKQDESREQEKLNGGVLSPEQPEASSSLTEPSWPIGETRAFNRNQHNNKDQQQDKPREQQNLQGFSWSVSLNGGALSPEQPKLPTSSLAEPTTPFNVRDSEENEEPGSQLQSFQEPEAEEPASETQINTDEKCENSPRPQPSVFKCFSRFWLPKIRMPKLSFKKWRKRAD